MIHRDENVGKAMSGAFAAVMLMLLMSCGGKSVNSAESGGDSAFTELKTIYENAREAQRNGDFVSAIEQFDRCIAVEMGKGFVADSLLPLVANSMLQMMNCYQSMGKPNECTARFDSLRQNHSHFVDAYALRDVYMVSAYATSRTDRMREAELLADSALTMPLHKPTHERLFRDYAYAAAVFFSNLDRQQMVIDLSRKALAEARMCGNTSGAQYVTAMLGMMLRRTGRLPEAIDLYLESLDEAKKRGDGLGQATACNTLAELYLYWKLPKYAATYASMAIDLAENNSVGNTMIYAQSLLMRGRAYCLSNKRDSAMFFYGKAENVCGKLPYTDGAADVDYHVGALCVNGSGGDSLASGLKRLKKVMAEGTPLLKAKAYYQYAIAMLRTGRSHEADAALDSMYLITHSSEHPQHIDIDYKKVLDYYVSRNDVRKIKLYAKDLADNYDVDGDASIRTKMYETIVNMQTEAEKQRLQMKNIDMENSRLWLVVWLVLAVGIAFLSILWIVYKNRLAKTRMMFMQEKLDSVAEKLARTSVEKERAEQQLSSMVAVEMHEGKIDINTTSILHSEGEEKFRYRFSQLYPSYLSKLRSGVQGIGRKEELLCMLVMLGFDSQQVAVAMGIAHSSVNMARYRLRKKMNLGKEDSLDDKIRSFAN